MRIGVLALQGDFAKHIEMLLSLGVDAIEVRTEIELNTCDGIIIPGGESTVIMKQLDFIHLRKPLLEFASKKPLFGTCAGLILMSRSIQKSNLKPFELLNVEVERNAYGRQIASFEATIQLELFADHITAFPAIFIRAPCIRAHKGVQILGSYKTEAVLVRQGFHLGAAFHPELTDNPAVHRYFIEMIKQQQAQQ